MAKSQSEKVKKTEKEKKRALHKIYDKKPLIEFVVAVLSVPSLILLVILNFNSLKNINGAKPTPTPTSTVSIPGPNGVNSNFFGAPLPHQRPTSSTVSQTPCNKSLGPVSITSPKEGDTVNSNPVEIDISYPDTTYCAAAWSYRINGGTWSSYDDRSVALYNLPNGAITFDLRVKSIASSDETSLTRHFTYTGQSTVSLPAASSSAQ